MTNNTENRYNVKCYKCDQIGTNYIDEFWRCSTHHQAYLAEHAEYENRKRIYDFVTTSIANKIDFRLYYLYKYWSPRSECTLPYEMILEIQKYLTEVERNYYGPENRLPIKQLTRYFPEHYVKDVLKTKGKPIKDAKRLDGLKATDKFERYSRLFRMEVYDDRKCGVNFGLVKINNRYYVNKCLVIRAIEKVRLMKQMLRVCLD